MWQIHQGKHLQESRGRPEHLTKDSLMVVLYGRRLNTGSLEVSGKTSFFSGPGVYPSCFGAIVMVLFTCVESSFI